MDKNNIENEAKHAAERAVAYDSQKLYKQAICYYDIAARLLSKLDHVSPLFNKAIEYRQRTTTLQKLGKNNNNNNDYGLT